MATRLAVFGSHPIQYKAPLYRKLAATDDIEPTVFYGSHHGIEDADLGFGAEQSWDLPLLEGYDHKFLRNYTPVSKPSGFLSLCNPGLFSAVDDCFDALLVHTGYYRLSSVFAVLAANQSGVPTLLHGTGHADRPPEYRLTGTTRALKRWYVRTFLRGIDTVLADCNANAAYYRSFGVDSGNIYVMPCAVDNDRFRAARSDLNEAVLADLRADLDLPAEAPVVLFVGKLINRKRPFDLLEAYAAADTSASLVFVGDGPLRDALEAQVARRSIDGVRFAGYRGQTELPAFYEMADLLVLPSAYDPSPKVLNEAMNFATPVLASNGVGTARDLLAGCGEVFPMGQTTALRQKLECLLTDLDALKRMGERAVESVGEWSFERDIEVLREALNATIAEPSSGVV